MMLALGQHRGGAVNHDYAKQRQSIVAAKSHLSGYNFFAIAKSYVSSFKFQVSVCRFSELENFETLNLKLRP